MGGGHNISQKVSSNSKRHTSEEKTLLGFLILFFFEKDFRSIEGGFYLLLNKQHVDMYFYKYIHVFFFFLFFFWVGF